MNIFYGWLVSYIILTSIVGYIESIIPHDLTDDNLFAISRKSDKVADEYTDTFIDYLKTGIMSSRMQNMTNTLISARSGFNWANSLKKVNKVEQFVACTVCRAVMKIAVRMFRDGNGPIKKKRAKKALLSICELFNIQTQETCGGFFDIYWPVFKYILQNTNNRIDSFCGALPISFCRYELPQLNWTLRIDNNGANIKRSKSLIAKRGHNDLRILHITDFHYDPEYQPGSLAVCEEPLCCQRMPTGQVETEKLAGYWGDYHVCDAPKHLIENALDHMRLTHKKIDYIYFTGDSVSHHLWKSTKEENKAVLTEVNDLILDRFPNTPVYSCLGNHDSHPTNIFSPENVPKKLSTKWLYKHAYKLWSHWLPKDTKETILRGGYYTVSPRPGFRIISVNNHDGYALNWWLYHNASYVIEQLQWLHDTLLAAEKAREYVHILLHVPTGEYDCWYIWSKEFNRLIRRFHLIISGIFNGHTHWNDLNVYYTSKGHAVNVAWNGGSITTYIHKNPNYRIYDVEPVSMQVVDLECWIFNLTAANENGIDKSPDWFKLYQFSKEFTDDLSPTGIDILLEKMARNPHLLRKFWRFKVTNSDPLIAKGCDSSCLMSTICDLPTTVFNQKRHCRKLQKKLENYLR